jgi:2-phosphosulfolactate phosphatase
MKSLEVLFTPADFAGLARRNLDDTVCVVFDVFRATSSMVTALAHGANAIVPVAEISEALAWREKNRGVLLAGERDGLRIRAELTGGVDFDLGNSPREFTGDRVQGKTIVMSTTNGTRALRSCAHAQQVLISCFLNLKATADWLRNENPEQLLLVCSGTFEQSAYEDVLAAGALCELCWPDQPELERSDATRMARRLFQQARADLSAAAADSRNGRRLLSRPELSGDVPFCLRLDATPIVGALGEDGMVRAV